MRRATRSIDNMRTLNPWTNQKLLLSSWIIHWSTQKVFWHLIEEYFCFSLCLATSTMTDNESFDCFSLFPLLFLIALTQKEVGKKAFDGCEARNPSNLCFFRFVYSTNQMFPSMHCNCQPKRCCLQWLKADPSWRLMGGNWWVTADFQTDTKTELLIAYAQLNSKQF